MPIASCITDKNRQHIRDRTGTLVFMMIKDEGQDHNKERRTGDPDRAS